MELALVFDILSSIAVIFGIIIGLLQLRQYNLSRKRETALYLLNSYRTGEFMEGIWIIQELKDGLGKSEIDKKLGDKIKYIGLVMSTWESIGILLFNHEITLDMINEAFSGPILFSWQKLENYVTDLRKNLERETLLEWFQWLSNRIKEEEKKKSPIPAYINYQEWK